MQISAAYWIEKLQLTRHIEGGSFREIYRSPWMLHPPALPSEITQPRNLLTSIYFLLEKQQFSAFHRIKSDELWHFYAGDSLCLYELLPSGLLKIHHLGPHGEQGDQFQCVITAGNWFAAQVKTGGEYTLAGCTVAPGFDFADFELADREKLTREYPQHKELISRYTYS